MRPHRLELKGFSTFREHTIVDFDDADLLAFVGPTGAGKSTLIDAIGFALYGSITRVRRANVVAPVINQLSTEARVRLDFSVDGRDFTAVRVVRRTRTGATTREARLESGDETLAGSAGELDEVVEELLGLDFDQFTKTIVLPQGDFARFLTEPAGDRQTLLRRLLGMERYRAMGSAARDIARRAAATIEALDDQLATAPPVTAESIATAESNLARLMSAAPRLASLTATVGRVATDHATAEVELREIRESVDALRAIAVPEAATTLGEDLSTADAALASALARVDATNRDLDDRLARAAETAEPADLERLIECRAMVQDERGRLRDAETEATTLLDAVAAADADVEKATARLDETTGELHRRRVHAGAAGVASTLVLGEPCPVCRRPVDELPAHDDDLDIDGAVADVEDAKRALAAARHSRDRTNDRSAEATARARASIERIAELEARLEHAPADDALAAQLERSQIARAAVDDARLAASQAAGELARIDDARRALDERVAAMRQELATVRDGLASLDAPVPAGRDPLHDWRELADWATERVGDRVDAAERAAERVGELAAALEEHQRAIRRASESVGAGREADPVLWIRAEIARLEVEIERDRAELERQAAADASRADAGERAAVATELGRLLGSSGFEQWLMADVLDALAVRASARLATLTGGAYELVADGAEFAVLDHRNADEVRSARTLSGGETFLASLALALALSESVAELATDGAPRIESMFLDEGFGTLDPETLDTVANALEELGASGMMVGIVTHIRELADRMPVRFEVTRGPSTSNVVRVQ